MKDSIKDYKCCDMCNKASVIIGHTYPPFYFQALQIATCGLGNVLVQLLFEKMSWPPVVPSVYLKALLPSSF